MKPAAPARTLPARINVARLSSTFYGPLSVTRNIKWDKDAKLGEGAFGDVYRGELQAGEFLGHSWPNTPVAVKVSKNPPESAKEQQYFLREVEIMSQLRHPALANYVTCSMGKEYILVTELARSDLQKILDAEFKGQAEVWQTEDGENVEWDSTKRTICAFGITFGLAAIHKLGIIHRDVKPENVLLDEQMRPKIADYGLARHELTEEELQRHIEMTYKAGTALYMAPEVFNPSDSGDPYTTKADVYSYAMLLYSLVTAKRPFYDASYKSEFQFFGLVADGKRPNTDDLDGVWAEIMERCWDTDPGKRPDLESISQQILANPQDFYMDDTVDAGLVDEYIDWVEANKVKPS